MQEKQRINQPVKGIHTRASDMRQKSVLENLLRRRIDESEEFSVDKSKGIFANEKNKAKID